MTKHHKEKHAGKTRPPAPPEIKRAPDEMPRVAVVLGGGGLKPLAALPLFEYLQKKNIPLSLLIGCSGGSVVVSAMGRGLEVPYVTEYAKKHLKPSLFPRNWRSISKVLGLAPGSFTKTTAMFHVDKLQALFRDFYGSSRLETLSPKTVLQATDYETGEGICLTEGNVADAVYASSAVYPFFPPLRLDGRWLFDGLYSSPLPLMEAVRRGADVIIAVDFMEKLQSEPRTFFEAMVHVNKVFTQTIVRDQVALSIDLHHYEIVYVKVRFEKYIYIWDVDAFDRILEAGRQAVAEKKSEILAAVRGFRPSS